MENGFKMTLYRTRTYIAADFDHDQDVVEQLMEWNNSDHWGLSFSNAHDLESCRDSSLYCTIKKSLRMRMSGSKRFVLIVGNHTNGITKGGCQYCHSYNSYTYHCVRGYSIDYRSYIKFECDLAVARKIKVIVLYKNSRVNRSLCPESVKWIGMHIPLFYFEGNQCYWNYQDIKKAFDDI